MLVRLIVTVVVKHPEIFEQVKRAAETKRKWRLAAADRRRGRERSGSIADRRAPPMPRWWNW